MNDSVFYRPILALNDKKWLWTCIHSHKDSWENFQFSDTKFIIIIIIIIIIIEIVLWGTT